MKQICVKRRKVILYNYHVYCRKKTHLIHWACLNLIRLNQLWLIIWVDESEFSRVTYFRCWVTLLVCKWLNHSSYDIINMLIFFLTVYNLDFVLNHSRNWWVTYLDSLLIRCSINLCLLLVFSAMFKLRRFDWIIELFCLQYTYLNHRYFCPHRSFSWEISDIYIVRSLHRMSTYSINLG
jgi:hypothetical protein